MRAKGNELHGQNRQGKAVRLSQPRCRGVAIPPPQLSKALRHSDEGTQATRDGRHRRHVLANPSSNIRTPSASGSEGESPEAPPHPSGGCGFDTPESPTQGAYTRRTRDFPSPPENALIAPCGGHAVHSLMTTSPTRASPIIHDGEVNVIKAKSLLQPLQNRAHCSLEAINPSNEPIGKLG